MRSKMGVYGPSSPSLKVSSISLNLLLVRLVKYRAKDFPFSPSPQPILF